MYAFPNLFFLSFRQYKLRVLQWKFRVAIMPGENISGKL